MREFALAYTQVGHAIAAVGIIDDGPLTGDVVALNSWGVVELYRSDQVRDGLEFLLIK